MAQAVRRELLFGRLVRCFADRPASIDAMFREAVLRAGERDALVAGGTRLTYRALDAAVERVAGNLARRGFRKGDRLALLLGNRIEFVLCILAGARLGLLTVPMNTRQRAPEIEFVLNQCGASGLVLEHDCAANLPPDAAVPGLRERFAVGGPDPSFDALLEETSAPSVAVAQTDVMCLLYTSGTTGRPKGAMLTHVGCVHSCLHYEQALGLRRDAEVSVLAVPASHVTGLLANILTMIRVGGSTVMMPTFKARDFLAVAAAEGMTHTLMVPAMYNLCLLEPDLREVDLARWRVGGFGGAPMPEATIARLAELLPDLALFNAYGSTETTSPATLLLPGDVAHRPDSVGKALACADVLVVDEQDRELPPGQQGELWIGGPMVVPGYWANPDADAAGFAAGYWRSGDIGLIDEAGFVRILDRKKDMINRAGFKVYCVEVENVIAGYPGIIECAVAARSDPVLGEKVEVFVHADGPVIDPQALRAYCADRLASYKLPDFVTVLPHPLPRNANGKVLKRVLTGAAGPDGHGRAGPVAPAAASDAGGVTAGGSPNRGTTPM